MPHKPKPQHLEQIPPPVEPKATTVQLVEPEDELPLSEPSSSQSINAEPAFQSTPEEEEVEEVTFHISPSEQTNAEVPLNPVEDKEPSDDKEVRIHI